MFKKILSANRGNQPRSGAGEFTRMEPTHV